jgi:CRP/FNR family transcriptional regulator, dissimilatory nitrate respiration regulator
VIPPTLLRASVPALAELPDATLRWVARLVVVRRYAARAVLYRTGDPAAALYFVLDGRIRVAHEREGADRVLHHEGPGGVLGEIPVFGGGEYPATATATEATRCAVLAAADAERLLREEPSFARFALRRMALRARVLLHRLDELSSVGVTARVAAHLLARADLSGGGELTLGMSQAALAEELGTAREVIVRSLRALCTLGAIRRSGRARFVVASLPALRAAAEPADRSGLRAPPPARRGREP